MNLQSDAPGPLLKDIMTYTVCDADEVQQKFLPGRGPDMHHPWAGSLLGGAVQEMIR